MATVTNPSAMPSGAAARRAQLLREYWSRARGPTTTVLGTVAAFFVAYPRLADGQETAHAGYGLDVARTGSSDHHADACATRPADLILQEVQPPSCRSPQCEDRPRSRCGLRLIFDTPR